MSKNSKTNLGQFLKGGVIRAVIAGGKLVFDERARADGLALRDRERPRDDGRWFTTGEYRLIGALATLILPSDETGPGASEAGVVDTLDHLVATSRSRQALYARGLYGFDELAQRKHGRGFAELTHAQQVNLLKMVDPAHYSGNARTTSVVEVKRKLTVLYRHFIGPSLGEASVLFPVLVGDVLQAFYSSRVAWDWLGYDGPPGPRGYTDQAGQYLPIGKLEAER